MLEGSCSAPDVPDDPDTDVGSEAASCALSSPGERSGLMLALLVLAPLLVVRRSRRRV